MTSHRGQCDGKRRKTAPSKPKITDHHQAVMTGSKRRAPRTSPAIRRRHVQLRFTYRGQPKLTTLSNTPAALALPIARQRESCATCSALSIDFVHNPQRVRRPPTGTPHVTDGLKSYDGLADSFRHYSIVQDGGKNADAGEC